jgi:DNA polymerase III subunit beta
MKFSCTQENLNSGLQLVSHIAARGTSLPILNNILLRATPGGLELTATNLEVAIITTIRGKAEGDGLVTIQGKLLSEAVGLLPKERVDLELDGSNLNIVCGKTRTVVRGVPADDFPVIPTVDKGIKLHLDATQFAQSLESVVFAINPDEGRPEISGVYIGNQDKTMVLVGTDSYRLAEHTMPYQGDGFDGFILPLRAALEVSRVIRGGPESALELTINENQALWQIGDTRVISRLIAGQYPDYKQIIPRSFATTTKISVAAFIQAIRSASLFVRSGINDVRLVFSEKGLVTVSSTNSQLGENSSELEAVVDGQTNEIVFNYRYLLDGLQALSSDMVEVSIVSPTNPGMIRAAGGSEYLYIIMPIRQ